MDRNIYELCMMYNNEYSNKIRISKNMKLKINENVKFWIKMFKLI